MYCTVVPRAIAGGITTKTFTAAGVEVGYRLAGGLMIKPFT